MADEVLPPPDVLDSQDFDAIAYVNKRFPNEQSLSDLDTFVVRVSSQISVLDEEISRAVQQQSLESQRASIEISAAQQSIQELFSKISDIKSKASQSERMVQEICADIKKLDFAKTHLQSSITSLKRLQMLVTAVGQLELLAHEYHYREAANLLDAVNQLLGHFKHYTSIPMIAGVQQRVDAIKSDLKKHVHRAFREIGQLVDTVADPRDMVSGLPGGMRALSDACLVVDALGIPSRKELLEEFVQLQLVPYEKLFGSDGNHFSLDDVERRWAWFKRLLKTVDAKFANICPTHWRLPLRLCLEFTERTKIHLVMLLTMMESRDDTDVHALLKALQTTLRFEQEMGTRFGVEEVNKETYRETFSRDKENPHRGKSTLAYSPLEKSNNISLRDNDHVMYLPTDHTDLNAEDEEESGFLQLAHGTITCGISGVFDKFLGAYVLLERQNLEDMLKKLSEEEDSLSGGAGGDNSDAASTGNVYSSSMSMFVFIKNSIKRCTTLTTGQTFLALVKEFQTCMKHYQELLKMRCPPPLIVSTGGGITSTFSSVSHSSTSTQVTTYRIPAGGEVGLCYLVNTGEYCSTVVPQLEVMIKGKIAQNLADKVDLSEQVDVFMDLVAHALKVLVAGMVDRLEPAFKTMQSIQWGALSQVNEESQYIHMCNSVLMDALPKIRESLAESYFKTFCTKLASEILTRYLEVIMRQKRIAEVGTQQLLLDTYNIKTLLLHLQNLGMANTEHRSTVPPVYTKLVMTRTAHIETVLKLVGTSEEMLVERFRIMWPEGQAADLVSIMTLKGIKKQEQQNMLDACGFEGDSSARGAAQSSQPSFSGGFPSVGISLGGISTGVTSSAAAASSSMRNLTQEITAATKKFTGGVSSVSATATTVLLSTATGSSATTTISSSDS